MLQKKKCGYALRMNADFTSLESNTRSLSHKIQCLNANAFRIEISQSILVKRIE